MQRAGCFSREGVITSVGHEASPTRRPARRSMTARSALRASSAEPTTTCAPIICQPPTSLSERRFLWNRREWPQTGLPWPAGQAHQSASLYDPQASFPDRMGPSILALPVRPQSAPEPVSGRHSAVNAPARYHPIETLRGDETGRPPPKAGNHRPPERSGGGAIWNHAVESLWIGICYSHHQQ